MLYIIFIILFLGIVGFLIFTYESKLSNLKRDLIILNSTVNNLKSRVPNGMAKVTASFKVPESKLGIIKNGAIIFLSPDENGLIDKIDVNMEVAILDEINYKGSVWFYVALPVNRTENCRGWVHRKFFTSFK